MDIQSKELILLADEGFIFPSRQHTSRSVREREQSDLARRASRDSQCLSVGAETQRVNPLRHSRNATLQLAGRRVPDEHFNNEMTVREKCCCRSWLFCGFYPRPCQTRRSTLITPGHLVIHPVDFHGTGQ